MGQQCSALADGTAAVTSSQHSSVSPHITSSESKIKTDSADARPNAAWKNSLNALMLSGRGESDMAEMSSLKSRTELEVSRMSIRAAIDTVIENCLSSNNDYSPQAEDKTDDDFQASDCSNEEVSGDLKIEIVSSVSRSAESSNEDSNKLLKTEGSEGCTQMKVCDTSGDSNSCVEVEEIKEVPLKKGNSEIKDSTDSFNGVNYLTVDEPTICEGDLKTRIGEKSLEKVDGALATQPRASAEKQTFSAYLQERFKTVDLEKCEELTKLAMSKDVQSHGQMLMWEVAKESPGTSDPGGKSAAVRSPFVTSGPVKLQAVIDRVLDNSLRNESQSPGKPAGDSQTREPILSSASSLQSLPDITVKDKSESSENIPAPIRKSSLCFKDHIEKVLLESFLSFEEDERQNALKAEAENNKPPNVNKNNSGVNTSAVERHQLSHSSEKISSESISSPSLHPNELNSHKNTITNKPSGDRDKQQNTNKDGTISVQDIVDQVISQTEMISKLLTPSTIPSTRDINKLSSSSGHADIAVTSSSMSTQANPGLLYQSSSHSRALVEAQRHTVQKEHQSSTNMGRKRGRPRLGSSVSSASKPAHDPGKSGYQDARGGHVTSHISDHPHVLHMNHHQFASAGGIPSMMASKNVAPPASVMIHQTHHMRQKSPSPSSVKKCLPGSASSMYQLNPHDSHHHHHQQHLPSHLHHQQNPARTHESNQMPSSTAPPPLILADKVKNSMSGGNQLMPVYHIPSQSCPCHGCRMFFSQLKHHPQATQHQHQLYSRQTSTADHDQRHSFHHSSSAATHTDSSAFYLLPVSITSEAPSPVVPVQIPGHPPPQPQTNRSAFTAGHIQRRDICLTSREPLPDGVNPRSYSQEYYHHNQGQTSQTHLVKSAFIDTRFTEPEKVIRVDHLSHTDESFQRVSSDCSPHYEAVERPKLEVARLNMPINQDDDHPLDLSVRPSPTRSQDNKTNLNSAASDLPRESSESSLKNSHYRWPGSGPNPGGHGHYVEHEQGSASGHHLQRLENSVDRFLSHQRPEAQFPMSSPYPHHSQLRQQRPKIAQLSPTHQTPPEAWGGQLQHYSHSESHYSEPHSRDHNIHSVHSDVSYTHHTAAAMGQMPPVSQPHCHPSNTQSSEDRRRYPSLVLQQNIHKNLITSHHIQQDHSTQNQFQLSRTISPASSQVHSRVGPESENKPFTATDSAFAASPCPESSPSPDDSQKLNACKHEPIQNIIGKHPPSDILYLICRLCRQTYGSPYCFRKHFRNQHGFEPKADHTIVQTISATKTAMAHTGSSDVTVSFAGSLDAGSENPAGSLDLVMTPTASSNVVLGNMESFDSTGKPLRSVQMEKASNNDHSPHTQSVKSLAAGTTPAVSTERLESPLLCEETKLSIKKDSLGITKYLECPECGQSFQLNDFGSYKRHCRQHSLSRSSGPYACHECERSFSEPAHLQEHQATHSGFTPSVCAICHTLFSSANYLAEHLQAAHGVTCVSEGKQSLIPNDSASEPLRKSEPLALTDMSKLKRSSSFPDWFVMESPSSLRQTVGASASSHSATPSPSRHSTTPLAEPQMMIKCTSITQSASVNRPLIMPKLPRYSKTAENAYMLTVHTPKGLEIQKLPADAVVTTASPDSSYDEAKLFLDASQGGGTFQRDNQDFVRASNNLGEGSPGQDNKNSIIKQSRPNDNTGNVRYDNKEEMESNSSGRESLNGSRAPSPAGIEEEPFYKHKKYSLHRKRTNISEASSEPSAKSLKIEGNIVSVSSTGNSGVTVQDCESSSTRLEDSSLSWRMYTEEQVETDKITKHEQGDNYGQSKGNKSNINAESDNPRESSKRYGPSEGGEQFKWDRQTRSQAGKIISQ